MSSTLPVTPQLAYLFAVVRGVIYLFVWLALVELILGAVSGIRFYEPPHTGIVMRNEFDTILLNFILPSLPVLSGLLGLIFGYSYPAASWTWGIRLALPLGLVSLLGFVSYNRPVPFIFIIVIYIPLLLFIGSVGAYIGGRLRLRKTTIPKMSGTAAISTTLAIVVLGIAGYNAYLASLPSEAAILSSIKKSLLQAPVDERLNE